MLIYEFIVISLIFYFGWLLFYNVMDKELNESKHFLSILNIDFLISNPYIQNYINQNLT